MRYPLIGDHDLAVAKLYGMLGTDSGKHLRGPHGSDEPDRPDVYLIGADKLIKAILVYPMTSGRNFDEVLRLLDSIQLTATHKVATPANWKHGEDVIIAGSVGEEEARKRYPQGWTAAKPYIRVVPQPKG